MCIVSVIATLLAIKVWKLLKNSGEKILGVYSRPKITFWVKKLFVKLMIMYKQYQLKCSIGGHEAKSTADMECPQKLSEHPKAIDAVNFNCSDANGNHLLMAIARRPEGVFNAIIRIELRNVGKFVLPRMPDTLLFGDKSKFEAEGLLITPVEPMKKWHLRYDNKLKLDGANKLVQAKIDAVWTANSKYFNFDTDMHPGAVANSMAKESWSRDYFETLKRVHQTHYEQMGTLRGSIEIDGKLYHINLDSMRDHSYGHKREWKLFHRYTLHIFHTQDGIHGNVGIVSQQGTFTHLELGYICRPDGKVLPVTSVEFPLWQHGEHGRAPNDYALKFSAGDEEYFQQVEVTDTTEVYMGWEWEAKVLERTSNYRLNGVPGWGVAEWCYRNHGGRPKDLLKGDPEWTKSLVKG